MALQLKEINEAVRSDPKGFMEECDSLFQARLEQAADMIEQNMKNSPVILLSGPSGSGKTTTAGKIEYILDHRGIETHTVSMDDYFITVDPKTAPRTPAGEIDLESPKMLDMDLMDEHFTKLSRGEAVMVPRFEFARQMRGEGGRRLVLGKDELAIFEGIHALNTDLTQRHPEAFRVYISARSNILDGEQIVFKGTWMRLARRAVRDYNFRGTDIQSTMKLWANVRRGEKLYISPYKNSAHLMLDTALPYEVPVMASYAVPLMAAVAENCERHEELMNLMRAFELFEPIDPSTVPADSLLHEFIG